MEIAADGSITISLEIKGIEESGFSFTVPAKEVARLPGIDRSKAVAKTIDGKPLPRWLRFNRSTLTFVAAKVPKRALPLMVKIEFPARNGVVHAIKVTIRK